MGTVIRPEVSKKNEYWIERHRFYELKHFCLQYYIWKRAKVNIDGLSKQPDYNVVLACTNDIKNPTERAVLAKQFYQDRINMVEEAAYETDPVLSNYILKAVTTGVNFTYLKTKMDIPCGKDYYYKIYHKFFYILDRLRK